MNVRGTIAAVVSDAAEKAVWEPVFNKMKEEYILMEHREVFHLLTDLWNKGESPPAILVSTRVYPLENPRFISQLRQIFPESDILLMGLSTDPTPPLGVILKD